MSNPSELNEAISRMRQEAELYESQGLFSHALEIYKNIVALEPEDKEARLKVVQYQFAEDAESESGAYAVKSEDLSPRQSLDLGIAYMGMDLYAEALVEFRKGLKSDPDIRGRLLRQIVICLLKMEKLNEARRVVDQIVGDRGIPADERGEIVADVASMYLDIGHTDDAAGLLMDVYEDLRDQVPDYDKLVDRISDAAMEATEQSPAKRALAEIEDSGEHDTTETTDDMEENTSPTDPSGRIRPHEINMFDELEDEEDPQGPCIKVRAPVSYSLDNKSWNRGRSTKIASNWAEIEVDEPLTKGDALLIRMDLPGLSDDDPVMLLSRVTEVELWTDEQDFCPVKVEFDSFLPGSEANLQSFIEQVSRDPSVLEEAEEEPPPPPPSGPVSVFDVLMEQAVAELEEAFLGDGREASPDEPAQTETSPEQSAANQPAADRSEAPEPIPVTPAPDDELEVDEDDSKTQTERPVRFSCTCGQVHAVDRNMVTKKGKCLQCQAPMVVPNVDTRPDGMTHKLIGKILGGCRVLYKLGGGGMGGVFKAYHIALDISVAMKILYAHLAEKDPVFIKRFIREARAAAKLQHPNIVGVMNVGYEDGYHFLVMPFVDGGSAAIEMAKKGPLPVERVLNIAVDMARALTVADENGILHRDVKPANILFTRKGESKLADLGLAKSFSDSQDSALTQTGIACGTPLYFSPEQAKGSQDLDIRSDIYSLGITLFHLLEGAPPFTGESAYVIFQKHVNEDLPPFTRKDPPIPEPVYRLIQKMTAKNRDDRFKDASELLDVVESLKEELVVSGKSQVRKGLLERLGIKRAS